MSQSQYMKHSNIIPTKYYKLKDSVDMFLEEMDNVCIIQFYKINTRQSVYIESSSNLIACIKELDGCKSLDEISEICNFSIGSIIKFIDFLNKKGLIIESTKDSINDERYIRQIAYFDDVDSKYNGKEAQEILESKKVVIFGIGSVGSSIAIILARMGIMNFVFIDYKKVNKSHIIKHLYCNEKNLEFDKTQALKEYILKINSKINIEIYNEKILPNTELKNLIPKDSNMVINTADEPYIGHTSMKIGRFCWANDIAFYVGGGFDAHSMSTGEMIIPHITPCIDCYVASFRIALKDYKPKYIVKTIKQEKTQSDIIMGGSGSIAANSLFSASFACMRIIYYFLEIKSNFTKRGEYLIDKGKIIWVTESKKQENCQICNGAKDINAK